MDDQFKYAKLNMQWLVKKASRIGLIEENEYLNYADYIHSLWFIIRHNGILGEKAKYLDKELGRGDSVQLLSDAMLELRSKQLEEH
tara:strand:- start:1826 stop:2083 length:258 start_codon:yes stop_codon:yes gene_type:complete